jgi:tRNA-(ms[2]io[6]A)-hydroxylase
MAEINLRGLRDLDKTQYPWVEVVLADFNTFLSDHASAEKKASGMALSMASHYPDRPDILIAMTDLAIEELAHYKQVINLILKRGLIPQSDRKDTYVAELNGKARKGRDEFLLDRLLIAALIERRGAERFELIAHHLEDAQLANFYRNLAKSEARHWVLFVNLASGNYPENQIVSRFNELSEIENDILSGLPISARLH